MRNRARWLRLTLLATSFAIFACDHGPSKGIPDGPPPEEAGADAGTDDDASSVHDAASDRADGSGETE
jgi:hypothetical protein